MIKLNFNVYPLVVGQLDKFTFSDYEVEGGKIQLQALVESDKYSEDDINWSSSDEEIAVVENGLVRAIRTGIADISAALPDGEKAVCRIQVIDNIGRLTAARVKLNAERLVLAKGEGTALYPMILPIDYFCNGILDTSFDWYSSDDSIVSVDHRGRVYAKEEGHVTITAASKDVGRTASCDIDVVFKKEKEIYLDPLEDMDGGYVLISSGKPHRLSLPEAVKDEPVCWSSLNESVVRVDENGSLYSACAGNAKVWATFVNGGKKVIYDIKVESDLRKKVSQISLNTENLRMAKGEQSALYAVVFPATVLEKQINWKSSDENVIRIVKQHINLSGLDEVIVEAVGEGEAAVIGTLSEMSVSCQVSVSETEVPIKTIVLQDMTIENEAVVRMIPKLNVGEAEPTQKDILWLSENRKALTVDKDGYIKAYEKGQVNLYAIARGSLDEAAMTLYAKLSDKRKLSEDLSALLKNAIYDRAVITIKEDYNCLYNLHIPAETVRADSVSLLWSRRALIDTGDFDYYIIYDNGIRIAETDALSYTVCGLDAESKHVFAVAAIDNTGAELCRSSVEVITKKKATVVIDVTKSPYNAVGDGILIETDTIQRAIDDCPEGGEVVLPEGCVFVSGALFLKSKMTFRVNGILLGSINPEDYPYVVCRWEGYRKLRLTEENYKNTYPVFEENVYSYSSLINVGVYDEGEAGKLSPYHTSDVCICGKGMINGNGFSLSYNEGPCWFTLRKGLPIPQSPVRNQDIRGRALAIYNTKGAYVKDVTVAYSPAWTVQAVFSDSITFDNVKVISMGDGRTGTTEGMHILNGDGIDPDSSININMIHCYFTVGDDAVAIKSGRNREGVDMAKPSAYIRVTDCSCVNAKGCFAVGSETAGGVHDVLFQNLKIRDIMHFGLWIKSAPCRGGLIEDILFRDCDIDKTGGAFQIEYKHGGDEYPSLTYPVTRRVSYENIRISGENKFGVRIMGEPESPVYDVDLRGVSFGEDFVAKKDPKFILEEYHDIRIEDTVLPEGYEWEK